MTRTVQVKLLTKILDGMTPIEEVNSGADVGAEVLDDYLDNGLLSNQGDAKSITKPEFSIEEAVRSNFCTALKYHVCFGNSNNPTNREQTENMISNIKAKKVALKFNPDMLYMDIFAGICSDLKVIPKQYGPLVRLFFYDVPSNI